ncbi:truncated non-functional calcium-binding mitochondrial carrier Sal1p-1 [[Candida] jaroonii]|uniref:Truncated non-functional calcium-binding mitochondrial carrier Sal1p-1 n=1 Tax=[Candida] jaroonii TaxID=467808 RepID=A0ACA9Y845_9ASCO|nr:truncated non-functional calcium-binding mitochondrial carrier Sal1p-1 [[Candida] jaroonii]
MNTNNNDNSVLKTLDKQSESSQEIIQAIVNDSKDYKKLFQQIDTHKSGEISLDEFETALKSYDHPIKENPELIRRIFNSFDINHDKKIDYNDFKNYLKSTDEQILRGFKNIDIDNDGKITKKDLINYLKESLGLKPSKDDIDVVFHQIDTENLGYITFNEFRNYLLLVPRLHGSRIKTAFQYIVEELDLTSDGDVTLINQFLYGFGYFLAGGISGVVSRTCTAPFDRIKVFLIARTDLSSTVLHSRKEIAKHITSSGKHTILETIETMDLPIQKTIRSPIIQAARTIWKQGGFKGFYVGNGLNILKVFPESAMKFGSFEAAKRFFASIEGIEDTTNLSKTSTYLAGGLGGVVAQFTVYPIDTLKFRVQCSNIDSGIHGNQLLVNTAKEMFQQGGLRTFYRGIIAGVGGIFPYAALDLGTFTTMKKWLVRREMVKHNIANEQDVKLPNYMVLTLGALSGSFGATMVYPINLLRTRLQAQGTYAHPNTYDGFFDVLQKTIKNEGYPGLFKGLVPNLAKVAPAVSISYFMYENLKTLFDLEVNK